MITFSKLIETSKGDFAPSKYCIHLATSSHKFTGTQVEVQVGKHILPVAGVEASEGVEAIPAIAESFVNSLVIANYSFDSKLTFEEVQAEVITLLNEKYPNNTFSKL